LAVFEPFSAVFGPNRPLGVKLTSVVNWSQKEMQKCRQYIILSPCNFDLTACRTFNASKLTLINSSIKRSLDGMIYGTILGLRVARKNYEFFIF